MAALVIVRLLKRKKAFIMFSTAKLKTVLAQFKDYPCDYSVTELKDGSHELRIANNEILINGIFSDGDSYLLDNLNQAEEQGLFFKEWETSSIANDRVGSEQDLRIEKDELVYLSLAMAKKDVRHYLNGLAVYANGGLCATDGHRLHFNEKALELHSGADKKPSRIIQGYAIRLALKLCGKLPVDVSLKTVDRVVMISFGEITLLSKRVDGEYPAIGRIIPRKGKGRHTKSYTAPDKKQLKLMVDVVKQYFPKFGGVKVSEDGAMRIFKDGDYIPLPAVDFKLFKTNKEMGLSAAYVSEALIPNGECKVMTGGENDSVLITHGTLSAIVMPIQL